MLINSNLLLQYARKKKFAIPSANFIGLESARSHVSISEKKNLPLFLSFAQSHNELLDLEEAALIGNYLAKKSSSPIVLHLDHGEDVDYIFKAIDLGFTSVMIDASQEEFVENIKITKEVVRYAHNKGVSVEAELGHVGSNDLGESKSITKSIYTEVKDVKKFVLETNVDSLAISIGTAHGNYTGEPKINFERLKEIYELTEMPLVLHGGSSSGDENLNKCATGGISKINIYTDFINSVQSEIASVGLDDITDLKEIIKIGMGNTLSHYFDVFETKPFLIGGK